VVERRSSSGAYGTMNWQDPESLLAVTRVLLRHDFGLTFDMPLNHLCPPVPQRLNYIHWIAELIGEAPPEQHCITAHKRARNEVRGIDMSASASHARQPQS